MVLDVLFGGIFLLFAAAGGLCALEALSYPGAQRAAVPWLWRAYLVGVVLATAVGLGGLGWTVVTGTPPWAFTSLLAGLALFLTLVQYRMHRTLGLDRSPLWARFE